MRRRATAFHDKENEMMLATTTVEDVDRFLDVFSTKGAEKRQEHGSKGATVFRDPNEADRVWVLFDWDAAGFQNYLNDPDVSPIIKAAGHKSKPQPAAVAGSYDA
jgi:quinol monooxygenase YgiN